MLIFLGDGRIGNQTFQYVFLKTIQNNNEKIIVSGFEELREVFQLNDFINWNVIQRTMFFEAPRVEYETVMCNSVLSIAINESKVGNPKRYYLDMSTSGNLIHHAYSISQLLYNCDIRDFNKY